MRERGGEGRWEGEGTRGKVGIEKSGMKEGAAAITLEALQYK